ncbi:hypothetical protein D9611_005983 [Ephemerocybe angulata]|uniref:Uncharacterized protein n=1 Tax=Ephemerocybe angulata TaxID=980116 RepID=A0A8H5CGD8_9AGAR|nr:hypothetical protein D9611_005983 [Tulosesus angulatus]
MAKWLGGGKESGLGVDLIVAGVQFATRDRTPSRHDPCPCNIPDLRELMLCLRVRWHEGARRSSQVISFFPTPACPLSRRRLTLASTLLGGRNSVASSSFDTVLALRTRALHPGLPEVVSKPHFPSGRRPPHAVKLGGRISVAESQNGTRNCHFHFQAHIGHRLPRTALSPRTRKTTVIAKRLRAIVDVATSSLGARRNHFCCDFVSRTTTPANASWTPLAQDHNKGHTCTWGRPTSAN